MLSNAYFLAQFRFDTAENELAKNLQKICKFCKFCNPERCAGHLDGAGPRSTLTKGDLQAFFARQDTHHASKRRALLTKQIRTEVERRKAAHVAKVLSPSTKEGFLALLSRKFGSPARAWRLLAADVEVNIFVLSF